MTRIVFFLIFITAAANPICAQGFPTRDQVKVAELGPGKYRFEAVKLGHLDQTTTILLLPLEDISLVKLDKNESHVIRLVAKKSNKWMKSSDIVLKRTTRVEISSTTVVPREKKKPRNRRKQDLFSFSRSGKQRQEHHRSY